MIIVSLLSMMRVVDSDFDLDELIERVEADFPLERVSVEYVSRDKIQLIL